MERSYGDECVDGRGEAAERTADEENREAGEEDAALAAQVAKPSELEHQARGDELRDGEDEADRDDVGAKVGLDDRRTVATALALIGERNPLAPIAVRASHFVRPGAIAVSMC